MVVVFSEYLGNISIAKKHRFEACATIFSGSVERLLKTILGAKTVSRVRGSASTIDSFRFLFQHHSDALN
jgi:hypothetical protein